MHVEARTDVPGRSRPGQNVLGLSAKLPEKVAALRRKQLASRDTEPSPQRSVPRKYRRPRRRGAGYYVCEKELQWLEESLHRARRNYRGYRPVRFAGRWPKCQPGLSREKFAARGTSAAWGRYFRFPASPPSQRASLCRSGLSEALGR